MVSQRDRMQSPEKRMVNIPPFHWTVLDEKIFLRGVIDRLQHRSSTLGRFGAPEVFVEQYLAGLNQRCVGFDGTKGLDVTDRAEIRAYAEALLNEVTTEAATDRMLVRRIIEGSHLQISSY
jgi:hypothetical protein